MEQRVAHQHRCPAAQVTRGHRRNQPSQQSGDEQRRCEQLQQLVVVLRARACWVLAKRLLASRRIVLLNIICGVGLWCCSGYYGAALAPLLASWPLQQHCTNMNGDESSLQKLVAASSAARCLPHSAGPTAQLLARNNRRPTSRFWVQPSHNLARPQCLLTKCWVESVCTLQYAESVAACSTATCWCTSGKNSARKSLLVVTPPVTPMS